MNNEIKRIIEDHKSPGVSVFSAASLLIGSDILTLDDDTIKIYLYRNEVFVNSYNINKIMGCIYTITDESVFIFPTSFTLAMNAVVNGINTGLPADIPTVIDIALFLVNAKFLVPHYSLDENILGLIIKTLEFEGFWKEPKIIKNLTGISLKEYIPVFEPEIAKEAYEIQEEKNYLVEVAVNEEIKDIYNDLQSLGLTMEEIIRSLKE